MKKTLSICVTTLLLSSCGGGGGGGSAPAVVVDPVGSTPEAALAVAGSPEAFTTYMSESLAVWGGLEESSEGLEESIESPFPRAAPRGTALPEDIALDSSLAASAVSAVTGTNVSVVGVDEMDAAKYNGTHLFLANNKRLTVLEADGASAPSTIAHLKLVNDEDFSGLQGLYLHEFDSSQRLAAVRGSSGQFFDSISILPYFGQSETRLDLIDVSNPALPVALSDISIQGTLIESRRIGERLFLVTQFSPALKGFQTFPTNDEARENNEEILANATPEDLIPSYTQDGIEATLVDPDSCLLPSGERDGAEYPTLTTITAINLESDQVEFSTCLVEGVWGIHMTDTSLYIASPDRSDTDDFYSKTAIHKFVRSNERFDYQASGTLPGSFWGDPTFLMAEIDGRLTAITTEQGVGESRFSHRLSILDQDSGGEILETLGSIPNASRPETIGKPNEQIFASRFFGERAYVVTFEQIDPVYAIDLSDPSDPRITGELEIPGFSSYLHPISEDLLLGIGSNTRVEDGVVMNDGVNVRLFDVGTEGAVSLIDEKVFGRQWSFSPVAFDYHAFTLLQFADEDVRFAVPISRYGAHLSDDELSVGRISPWTDTALQLLSIDFTTANPSLRLRGQITAEDHTTGQRYQPGCCGWQARSFFNGDSILYLNKNRLFQSNWTTPAQLSGETFIETLFADGSPPICDSFIADPISVSLFDRISGEYLSCGFTIPEDPDDRDLPEESEDEVPAEDATSLAVCENTPVVTDPFVDGAGSYAVTASIEGYHLITVNDVRIQANACHLGTTHLELYLNAE